MILDVLILPGDGIGPEVIGAAVSVLRHVAARRRHELLLTEGLIGGAALRETGVPLPDRSVELARRAGATLLGAVGLPEFDGEPPERRPEKGLLDLRKALAVYANLRPVRAHPALLDASPLKNERVRGTDLLIVRELTGGLYYGTPRGIFGQGQDRALNTMAYSRGEIERVARVAFRLASSRRRRVTSVDKANVLETSQLWRRVVGEVAADYPEVTLEHLLVDNCAMQLVSQPRRFDVVVTENMFGDILSDEAAVLAGSIGMLPSASMGERESSGRWPGLYEPVHGSAPELAGKGSANPLGAIASVAALLYYSFGLHEEAALVQRAMDAVLAAGVRTADLATDGTSVGTEQMGAAVCAAIDRDLDGRVGNA